MTDIGKVKLGNEDACACSERTGVFVLSDGMGGLPAGGAVSRVIVHAFPVLIERGLHQLDSGPDDFKIEQMLANTTHHLNESMYEKSQLCTGLAGWGATLSASLFRKNKCHLVNVGDSRAYLLRNKMLVQLTSDDSIVNQLLEQGELLTVDWEQKHKNLISQHVAMKAVITPSVRTITMKPGDRLLLCSDGLCGPVDDKDIGRMLLRQESPTQACHSLIAAANAAGGPDNITAVVVHYNGTKEVDADPPPSPQATGVFKPIKLTPQIADVHQLLQKLEKHFAWLESNARKVCGEDTGESLNHAKQVLGADRYKHYAAQMKSKKPSHVFFAVCMDPEGPWRQPYDSVIRRIDPMMAALTSGTIDLCPLIPNDSAALTLKSLWNETRGIERRLFTIHGRPPMPGMERAALIVIHHLHESVRSLVGLLEFLPAFGA